MKRVLKWVFSFVLLLLSVLYLGNLDIEAKEAASSGLDLSRLYGISISSRMRPRE